jgi:STE24 endopeptidase
MSFPFSVLSYRIERAYQLSKQSFLSWLGDQAKGLAVMVVIGTAVMGLLQLSMFAGAWWWLVASTLFLLFSVRARAAGAGDSHSDFLQAEADADGPLKETAPRPLREVSHRRERRLSLGPRGEDGEGQCRVRRHRPDEADSHRRYDVREVHAGAVEAVFAHELGHQVHDDLWKGLGLSAVFNYPGVFRREFPRRALRLSRGGNVDRAALRPLLVFPRAEPRAVPVRHRASGVLAVA